MLVLRDYQTDAIKAIYEYWDKGKGKNPLVSAPTGSGKSLIIAELVKKICTEWPEVRIACVTHSRELIDQNEKELRGHYPDASTGVYCAGLNRKQTQARITFASIQSIYNHVFDLGKKDIIIIDEAHRIPRNTQTQYGRFLEDMKFANPSVVAIGLTATPYRSDSGLLYEGEDRLFDGLCYEVEIQKLVDQGYLVPVISKGGLHQIDLSDVHIRMGDYKKDELEKAADIPELVKNAVVEIIKYGEHRKSWLIFASGVKHAQHVCEELNRNNIDCEVVIGSTETNKRDDIISRFKKGTLKCIVNVGVLTTGFNSPMCDLIALLTATKSTGKYVQMIGRGMRTYPDKEDCLVLDFGGNILLHGPIDSVSPKISKGDGTGEPPAKMCPECQEIVHISVMICPCCEHEFPPRKEARHGSTSYDGAVMESQMSSSFVDISSIYCSRHKKEGSPDSLKVEFISEFKDDYGIKVEKVYPMWLCLDHTGYACEKAMSVVRQFGGNARNVTDALKECDYWKVPISIKVKPRGKFFDVVGIKFAPVESTKQQKIGETPLHTKEKSATATTHTPAQKHVSIGLGVTCWRNRG
jgi:DNA repair protein RadD